MTPLLPAALSFLEEPLYDLLVWIHVNANLTWAWSIIALTAIVRLAIMPITVKQTRSMLAMQKLQPYVKQLQQKHKDDRQALNVALMEFYRSNKVNPLASCLPLLLQIPIFLALFFVLKDFKPPAGTSDDFSFLWGFIENIRDTIPEAGVAGWLLLVFYVASQMMSTVIMSTSPDPRQKILFLALPVLFVPLIINFPIGVMLYWITTNLWTLAQHTVVTRLLHKDREIVLPPDSKGRQKTVQPKGQRGGASKDSNGSRPDSKGQGGSGTSGQGGQARRNKRRR